MKNVQSGRQAGWLMFLLLPFLCLLGVHVLVPLYFTVSTVPLLQEAYNSQRTTLEHHNVRSFTEINEQIITAQLNKYYQVFKTLQYLLDSALHDLSALQRIATQLNNAYLFAQTHPANFTYSQAVSMWFAPNVTHLSQLGADRFEALITYAGVEPYLRALLGGWQSSALLGVTTCVLTYEGTISFEFPSRFQEEFADLTASGESPYLLPTLNNFAISNQTVSAFVEISEQVSRLLFCSVLTDGDGVAFGCSCLNLDLQILGHQLGEAISFVPSSFTSTTYSLLLPVGPDLFLPIYRFGVGSAHILNATPVSTDYLSQHLQLTSADHTFIVRKEQTTLVFGPVMLQDASQKENRALFFMTENHFLPSALGKDQFSRSVDVFVGPVVTLIVLSAFASWWVLRRLLRGLQDELQDVEGRCRLILEGDLHMTVPPHEGSKDVREVTDAVRVINLLHRLSHSPHYHGHPVTKVLAYSHALHSLRQLNYDTAAALQNIGDCYLRMGESEKAVRSLKQSVRLALSAIESQHESLDIMLQRKRQGRVSIDYRFMELVLIRRLFHLLIALRTWLTQYPIITYDQPSKQLSWRKHTIAFEMPREKGSAGWRAAVIRETLEYILMLKKAFYPDFPIYAQCVLALLWEVKLMIEQAQLLLASALLQRAQRVGELYCESFVEVGRKLHQKGSRYKLFHSRNRISPHSRTHPDVIRSLCAQVKAELLLATTPAPYFHHHIALELLMDSAKTSVFSPKVVSQTLQMAQKLMKELNCKTDTLETTQLYRQSLPNKCLMENSEERQFIFLVDCGPRKTRGQGRASRAAHVFDRLVKGRDRVSIVKFHTRQGIKLECNLTFKEAQEAILRSELQRSFHEQSTRRSDPNQFFQAIERSLYRVRNLRCEKILIVFCRRIADYSHVKQRKTVQFSEIGPEIAELLQGSGIQHCKICVVGSEGDKVEDVRSFFGLEKVNELTWRGSNQRDNVVYVMGAGHRSDLDRVLGDKTTQTAPDNHIFLL